MGDHEMTDYEMAGNEEAGKKMSDHDKRLKIIGFQSCDGEQTETVLDTMATCKRVRDKYYILYNEYTEHGEKLSCRLVIAPAEVSLKKTGRASSFLRFRSGTRQEGSYQTPVGPMILVSDTKEISVSKEDGKLCAYLKYSLYMREMLLSDYELRIEVEV